MEADPIVPLPNAPIASKSTTVSLNLVNNIAFITPSTKGSTFAEIMPAHECFKGSLVALGNKQFEQMPVRHSLDATLKHDATETLHSSGEGLAAMLVILGFA